MPSNPTLDRLKEELSSLEREIPEKFQINDNKENSSTSSIDPSLIERYQQARDKYLKGKILQILLQKVQTCDGTTFEMPEAPSPEEIADLKERREQALRRVQATTNEIQRKLQEYHAQRSICKTRKEEIELMIEEMQGRIGETDEEMDDGAVEEEVDEEELNRQDERLAQLQQRKAELLAQIRAVDDENFQLQKSLKDKKIDLARLQGTNDVEITQESLAKMKEENDKMKASIAEYKEMADFYNNLRLVMEELRGVRVLAVSRAGDEDLSLKVKVLNAYDMELHLSVVDGRSSEGGLRVVQANFISDTMVRGPVVEGLEQVQIQIPPLDDLVRLSEKAMPGDGFRFVLREAMARITILQDRVRELTLLQHQVPSTIGEFQHDPNGFGGEDQDVVCRLSDEIAIVLRLTPDCPLIEGSVYIDQIVGLDDSMGPKAVAELKESVNSKQFKSPVELIQHVKGALSEI